MKIIVRIILIISILLNINVHALYTNISEINNKFITEKYHIELNGNGGTFSKQDKIIVFKKHMTLPTPKKEGYIFSHYSSINCDHSNQIEDVNKINNKELVAKWKLNKYQILYDLDGGELENKITEYTVEDEFEIPNPTKENSIFIGWTINNSEEMKKDIKINKGTTGNLFLKANWQNEKYKIKVVSIIDNILYENGLDYYTFDVWINDELIKESISFYEDEVSNNTKVRIKTNIKEGIETTYDKTIIVNENYIFKPEWTINEYKSEFYLDGILAEITNNKYGTKVKTPTIEIKWFGYSNDFYYISGFTPRESWYQKAYTLYFDTNIEQYNCMTSFGSTGINNAYQQLAILNQNGINNCLVNEGWNAVECYGKSEYILGLYNRVWNILPYSGNGYSRYKQMTCDSGYITSYNR